MGAAGYAPGMVCRNRAFSGCGSCAPLAACAQFGDMVALPEKILAAEIEAPDVLVGGTPCQAFSVAGLRGSLADARGNLTIILIGILNAIDAVRQQAGKPPSPPRIGG